MLSFDAYYRDQGHLEPADRAEVNYDHPDSLDADLLVAHLAQLQSGNEAAVPVYDFATHTRTDDLRIIEPADVVVIEGILLFAFAAVRHRLDFRVFRRCPEEVRFRRRLARDQNERGRTIASIGAQLQATVKPMHDRFVEPYASRAHYVTDHGDDLGRIISEVIERLDVLAPASR